MLSCCTCVSLIFFYYFIFSLFFHSFNLGFVLKTELGKRNEFRRLTHTGSCIEKWWPAANGCDTLSISMPSPVCVFLLCLFHLSWPVLFSLSLSRSLFRSLSLSFSVSRSLSLSFSVEHLVDAKCSTKQQLSASLLEAFALEC